MTLGGGDGVAWPKELVGCVGAVTDSRSYCTILVCFSSSTKSKKQFRTAVPVGVSKMSVLDFKKNKSSACVLFFFLFEKQDKVQECTRLAKTHNEHV